MNSLIPRTFGRFVRNVRSFYTSSPRKQFEEEIIDVKTLKEEEKVTLTFVKYNGKKYNVISKIGWSLMEAVRHNGLDAAFNEFGFCAGQGWCTSCHVFFNHEDFLKLPEASDDEEHYVNFLMDVIPGKSRLGCQVLVTKAMDGIKLELPKRHGHGWEDQD